MEDEAYNLFRGRRRQFSLPFFFSIYYRWKAWTRGVAPTTGGFDQQNPLLLQAFATLDSAHAWAESDASREARQRPR